MDVKSKLWPAPSPRQFTVALFGFTVGLPGAWLEKRTRLKYRLPPAIWGFEKVAVLQ